MAIGLPNIDIVFLQKAVSAVLRSERGTAVVILKDMTSTNSRLTSQRKNSQKKM